MFNNIILLFILISCSTLDLWAQGSSAPTPKSVCGEIPDKKALDDCIAKEIKGAAEIKKNEIELSVIQGQISSFSQVLIAVPCVPGATFAVCDAAVVSAQNILKPTMGIVDKAKSAQETCIEAKSKASLLCSLSSPQAQMGAHLMNQLSNALSANSSAKETCSKTSKASFAAEGVLLIGIAMCGKNKGLCEGACKEVNKSSLDPVHDNLQQVKLDLMKGGYPGTSKLEMAIGLVTKKISENEAFVGTCKSYAAGLADLVKTGTGLLQTALAGKACEQKLAGNTGGGNQSMTEMCAIPANAQTTMCKCQSNNTAEGCPGFISNLKNEGNLKLENNKASNVAGFGGKPKSGAVGNTALGDMSDDAKAILAQSPESKSGGAAFGAAGGANAGGAGSTGAGGAGAADKATAEEARSIGNSFGAGAMFRGSNNGGGGNRSAQDKLRADKYELMKRQLAAEQSEVSGASGSDNFTKVKKRYQSNVRSLMGN